MEVNNKEESTSTTSVSPNLQTSAGSAKQTGNSINSDKENNGNGKKRKRPHDLNHSYNDISGDTKTKVSPSCRTSHWSKKRRILEPYCFLSAKALHRHRLRHGYRLSPCAIGRQVDFKSQEDEDDDDDEWSNSSTDATSVTEGDTENAECDQDCAYENEKELFNGEKPAKESTPRNKSQDMEKIRTPILPVS